MIDFRGRTYYSMRRGVGILSISHLHWLGLIRLTSCPWTPDEFRRAPQKFLIRSSKHLLNKRLSIYPKGFKDLALWQTELGVKAVIPNTGLKLNPWACGVASGSLNPSSWRARLRNLPSVQQKARWLWLKGEEWSRGAGSQAGADDSSQTLPCLSFSSSLGNHWWAFIRK